MGGKVARCEPSRPPYVWGTLVCLLRVRRDFLQYVRAGGGRSRSSNQLGLALRIRSRDISVWYGVQTVRHHRSKRRGRALHRRYGHASARLQLDRVEKLLEHAMARADRRGYTGFMRGKGSLFDDPDVKRLMKRRDKILRKL